MYPPGIRLEEKNALKDAKDYLHERGIDVTIYFNDEATIERDKYNSIIKRTPILKTFHAYPVIYSPSQYKLEKAGIKCNVDVLITFATLDFLLAEISYDSIDEIRCEVELEGKRYVIKDVVKTNQMSHYYLNITIGVSEK